MYGEACVAKTRARWLPGRTHPHTVRTQAPNPMLCVVWFRVPAGTNQGTPPTLAWPCAEERRGGGGGWTLLAHRSMAGTALGLASQDQFMHLWQPCRYRRRRSESMPHPWKRAVPPSLSLWRAELPLQERPSAFSFLVRQPRHATWHGAAPLEAACTTTDEAWGRFQLLPPLPSPVRHCCLGVVAMSRPRTRVRPSS